ncbi:MAG: MerR family transcriptional regulator [Deltaproteobacteria bacterium]|nr:MerR family transcriptional regulator [Deltaproteobacteria bacterium]
MLTPEKRYYKISEAAAAAGVKPYVLRFWEGEFSEIRPTRTRSGQRLYTAEDLETILLIKTLLYDQKFTIPGARKELARRKKDKERRDADPAGLLEEVRAELYAIRKLLD